MSRWETTHREKSGKSALVSNRIVQPGRGFFATAITPVRHHLPIGTDDRFGSAVRRSSMRVRSCWKSGREPQHRKPHFSRSSPRFRRSMPDAVRHAADFIEGQV